MADQERTGRGLRLGEGQEVGGVLECGCNSPAVQGRDPKPVEHEEMERGPDCPGLGHQPIRALQRGDDFRASKAVCGHQRRSQGDVDIEFQLFALESFG